MLRETLKRATALSMSLLTLLPILPAAIPEVAAAEEDNFASASEIKVGETYTIHDDGPQLATFQQDGAPRNVWPMYTKASDGATIRAYCSDHSKTNPDTGMPYTVGARVDDMRVYGVAIRSDARNTRNSFISSVGTPLSKDNFSEWMYFCASQAAIWAALGEVKIAPGNINGISYIGSVALGYRDSGKTLSASTTTEALTLYAACKMLEYGNTFNQAWGPGGKGHAPWIGSTINYCPGVSAYSAAAAVTGAINFGASIASSHIWGEKSISGEACYVLPLAVASATFIRSNRAYLRMDNAPSGVFLVDENGARSTAITPPAGVSGSQMLTLTTKEDDSLYKNGNGTAWGATLYLCVPKTVAASLDATGTKLNLHFQSSMNVDRYSVFSATTSGSVQPVVMVEPAVWMTGTSLDTRSEDIPNQLVDLSVIKTDESSAPLSGCVFQINYSGLVRPESVTTDDSGEASFEGLPLNTDVTITETSAPEGYTLLPPKTINTGTKGGQKVSVEFANVDDHKFRVHKISSADGRNLMGATFEVRGIDNDYKNTFTTDALGEFYIMGRNLPTGSYEVYEVRAPDGFITDGSDIQTFEWDNSRNITLSFKNAPKAGIRIYKYDKDSKVPLSGATFEIRRDGQVLQTVQTDVNGYAAMYDLGEGFYQVVEIEPPQGYLKDDVAHEVYIDPTVDPVNIVREVNVPNTRKLAIRIIKIDKDTKVPLTGWKFDVYYNDAHLTSVTTNENGEAMLENLQPGTYRVKETAGDTEHYNMDAPEQTIELIKNQAEIPTLVFENTVKKHFGIYKIDAETHKPIEGVTFEIWKDGKLLGHYTTNENGRIWLPYAEPGTYQAKETVADPKYVLNETTFTIENNSEYPTFFTIPNVIKKDITVTKIDKLTGKGLEGVVFEGFRDGKSIGYFTTGPDGTFTIPYAPNGTYIFKEYHTLAGYELSREPVMIEHTTDGNSDIVVDNTQKPDLLIKKVDSKTRQALQGAAFKITRGDGSIVREEVVTDINGTILLPDQDSGTFIITEIRAPDGYVIDEMPKTVELRAGQTYEVIFTNTRAYGLQIRKVVKGTNQPLDHCTFTVEKASGERVGSFTTDSSGIATVTGLEDGIYVVTETSCPEGYRLDTTPQNVTVKAGELATVTFENERLAGVRIKKIDAVTRKGIYGVRFLIKDERNNALGEYSTDQDGYIELGDILTDGQREIKLKVEEIRAADGYVLDDTVRTLRIRRGETTELVVENTPILGQIQVIKKSAQDNPITNQLKGSLLAGAVFEITNADTGRVVDTITSDSRGVAASNPIPLGRYFVQEVQAPRFYQVNSQKIEVRLKVEGDVVQIEMYDDPAHIQTTIEKTGNYVVDAGSSMRYDFMNIGNASNVPLNSFFWHDRIPTDAVRAQTITTGTYNARVWYKITYKTNRNDYRTLADNLLSTNRYSFKIDAGSLKLASGEYVTDIRYEFGTVPAGFKMTEKATLLVYVPEYMANGYNIINRADAGGSYQGEWDSATSSWVTKIYRGSTYNRPTLPQTGY